MQKNGLRRFKEENGERIIGDYYIGTQSGLDDTFQCKKSDWIRVCHGVAWNPYFPYGKNIPIKFPCFYGGFYYESKQVWEESKTALLCFNDMLDKHNLKRPPIKGGNILSEIILSIPEKTPYGTSSMSSHKGHLNRYLLNTREVAMSKIFIFFLSEKQ